MTIGCEDSKRANRAQGFYYNPHEFALVGGPRELRSGFAQAIADALGSTLVIDASTPTDPYLIPQANLDADIVIITSDDPLTVPTIAWSDMDAPRAIARWSEAVSTNESMTHFTPGQAVEAATWLRDQIVPAPLKGLVLAGGRSTRMGEDKASLKYHGDPQFEHTAKLLDTLCEEVFISARPDQVQSQDFRGHAVLADRFLEFGPIGAILSAQKADPNAAWIVCACDLPYLEPETLGHLCRNRNPLKLATAFRSTYQDFPEPLCAIYEPKSIHRMLRFLGMGYHCPRKVLINSDTHIIEPLRAEALDNANTPEEREVALQRLGATTEHTS